MQFDIDNLVIKVEEGVQRVKSKRASKRIDYENDERVIKLKAMSINSSFFMENAEKKDARSLVELGKKVGVWLLPRETECDDIYQVKGVRVWRVEEHEMPRRRTAKAAEQVDQEQPDTPVEDPDDF